MLNFKKCHSTKKTAWAVPLLILLSITFISIFAANAIQANKNAQGIAAETAAYQEAVLEQEEVLEQEANASFYEKLAQGFDVNILIVGDSIGAGTSETSWAGLLSEYLSETYGVCVTLTNVSLGGNASHAGYVMVTALDDAIEYDLAIICYGQNDSNTNFSLYYETILRAIQQKYEKCSIISILESSQRDYTEKMQTIQSLCGYYEIPVADTIAAFNNSQYEYDELSNDGVHPNDLGKTIYFETVQAVIDENVQTGTLYNDTVLEPVNADVTNFDNFIDFSSADFEQEDALTYVLTVDAISGIMGMDYTYQSGEQSIEVYLDDLLLVDKTITFNYDFTQRHIFILSDDCSVENEIKIIFETEEQAAAFNGIYFCFK